MKILIIRFSSIGDIVLTSPIIRCVKNQFPHAEIHYVTKIQFQDLVLHNPYINKVYTLEGDIQPLVLKLLQEKYDLVIDLHKNLRTNYIKSLLKQAFNSQVKTISFNKLNIKKWMYTKLHLNLLPDKSIVERYFEALKPIGVKNDGQGLDFFIPSAQEVSKDDIPMSHMLGFVACAIGGQHETKKMPLQKWKSLCTSLQFPIILMGGKEDYAIAEEIKSIDPVKIYNACGKFSILESGHLIQKSRFVITHDTGLMHIAAAFKKPIISIWGNTVPALGMFPYYGFNNIKSTLAPQLHMIENNKLSCRPCSKIGYKACPKKHFKCMNDLDDTLILATANKIIADLKK